jgi:hypothetical protein
VISATYRYSLSGSRPTGAPRSFTTARIRFERFETHSRRLYRSSGYIPVPGPQQGCAGCPRLCGAPHTVQLANVLGHLEQA